MDSFLNFVVPLRGLTFFFGQILLFFVLIMIVSNWLASHFARKQFGTLNLVTKFNIIRKVSKVSAFLFLILFAFFGIIQIVFGP